MWWVGRGGGWLGDRCVGRVCDIVLLTHIGWNVVPTEKDPYFLLGRHYKRTRTLTPQNLEKTVLCLRRTTAWVG